MLGQAKRERAFSWVDMKVASRSYPPNGSCSHWEQAVSNSGSELQCVWGAPNSSSLQGQGLLVQHPFAQLCPGLEFSRAAPHHRGFGSGAGLGSSCASHLSLFYIPLIQMSSMSWFLNTPQGCPYAGNYPLSCPWNPRSLSSPSYLFPPHCCIFRITEPESSELEGIPKNQQVQLLSEWPM